MRTRLKHLAAIAVSTLTVASSALAGEPIDIKYKWTKGDVVTYRMVQDTTATTTVPGQAPMSMTQKFTSTTRMEVQDVAEDGAATVRSITEAVRVESKAPMMGEMVYDSSDPNAAKPDNPMSAVFDAMIGEGFIMVITPGGEIRSVEGMDKLLDKMADQVGGPMGVEAIKKNMGDEAMRGTMDQAFKMWAREGIEPGESWTGTLQQKLPMVGTMKMDATMTLKEVTQTDGLRLARIAHVIKTSFEPDNEGAMPGMTMTMEPATSEGETLFDLDRGQLYRMEMSMPMPLTVTMNQGGQTMTMKQDMTTKMVMQRVENTPQAKDKAPAEKPGS